MYTMLGGSKAKTINDCFHPGETAQSDEVFSSMFWGVATGALFGLMAGATPSANSLADAATRPLAKQLTKILHYKVFKKVGSILAENLLGDFTSWVMKLFSENYFKSISNAFN